MITITEEATKHLIKVLDSQSKPIVLFGLKGGGCAGFEYTWDIYNEDEYTKNKTDHDKSFDLDKSHKLILDGHSEMMLIGSTIDFKSDITGAMLVVENPNAASSCGCGTSVNFM